MTTVPVHGPAGAVGSASVSRPNPLRTLLAGEARAEAAVKASLQRWSIPALRIALGAVFAVFGALKLFPGVSPMEALVSQTWEKLTFGLVSGQAAMIATAAFMFLCMDSPVSQRGLGARRRGSSSSMDMGSSNPPRLTGSRTSRTRA